jgi:adenylate cyclase
MTFRSGTSYFNACHRGTLQRYPENYGDNVRIEDKRVKKSFLMLVDGILKNVRDIDFKKLKERFTQAANDYKMPLGEVLEQKDIITREQLQIALNEQKDRLNKLGKAVQLGKIIVDLGFAPEHKIVQIINDHYNLSTASLSDKFELLIHKKRGTFFERLTSARIPIWLKLSATITLIVVITIVLLNFIILRRQKEQLYEKIVEFGMVSLNYFSNNAPIPMLEDNILELNTLIKNATNVKGFLYAVIVDLDKNIKAHTDHEKIGTAFQQVAVVENMVTRGETTYFNYVHPNGNKVLNLAQPITFREKVLGEVHVGVSIDFIEQLIRRERFSLFIMTFIIVVLGVIVSGMLGISFSRPIAKLVLATQEISKGNYKVNLELNRNDELGNLAMAFNYMGEELWAKSVMEKSFGKYVGSEVLELIMGNPESAWLKGLRNEATVLITDIRGFTAYAEAREPEEVVETLNEYFEIATRVILEHGGFIDKFVGDAVLAVFGIPVYCEDHVERAVRAAFEMQREFGNAGNNGNSLLASIGISINTGVVVSGNIGSAVKMEYTVIGDTVNLASRLNGFAGPGEVIVSKSVYEHLKNQLVAEALPPQKVKGKSAQIEIFKVRSMREENDGNNETFS